MRQITGIFGTIGILLSIGSVISLATVKAQQQNSSNSDAARIVNGYNYRFDKNPFAPGNVEIVDRDFIQPGAFPNAEYCGHCHQETYHQWRQSLHANSFRTPFYLTSADILIQSNGIEYSRHCDSCHNPIAVLSGALTQGSHVDRKFDDDGVTCTVCHSIQSVQSTSGNGSYAMGVPAVMVDENGNRIPGEVPYDEILKYPERHAQAVMKGIYKTPEFCGACHKATVPASLNNYRAITNFDTYDEWQMSQFSGQNPLNFYPAKPATCQSCHMPREQTTLPDYGSVNKTLASHRWPAGNTAVPFYYGYDEQLKRTIAFLESGNYLNADIFAIKRSKDDTIIGPLGSVSFSLAPNETLDVYVVIQNKNIGHSLIPEIRDLYEAWVEFEAKDASGGEIYHSGFILPDGKLDPYAHSFVNRPIDESGNFVDNHEVWRARSSGYDNTIQASGSQLVRYRFQIPARCHGPITLNANVRYRHFRDSYLDHAIGTQHPSYPMVTLATKTRALVIGVNRPQSPQEGDNPDWMRWNNLGIAYLNEFAESGFVAAEPDLYRETIDAFQHAAELNPAYADAYTNMALTDLEWQKIELARSVVQTALVKSPGNARALYYEALIARKQSDFNGSIKDLEKVVRQYPECRDARRELGISYLAHHEPQSALKEFQALLSIDPENAVAHANLASLYRQFDMNQEAAEQQKLFEEEKGDPAAPNYSLQYLREHPEALIESVPGHVHSASLTH